MKKNIPFLIILFIIIGAGAWFYIASSPASTTEKFDFFVIEKGSSASKIGKELMDKGFIKSDLAFKIYMQFTGKAGSLQTGEFKLTPSYSLFQTVEALSKGPAELWVTIPEGLRREEIAEKFTEALGKNQTFIEEFMKESAGKEGYLFPETYLFPKDATAGVIVKKLTDTFNSRTKELKNNSGLTFEQAIVLASILERETKDGPERPIVAGIMLNRLNAGMPLQVDATVQYAVSSEKCKFELEKCLWWPTLTLADLSIKSPYNTYLNNTLPPTPISNPGLSSIKAALNPAQTNYWYYIHDPNGKIHYAKTLEEHNANIRIYLGK